MREMTKSACALAALLLLCGTPALAQSDADLAGFSDLAYSLAGKVMPTGWKVLARKSNPADGFKAASFIDGSSNVIIAYAGTNDLKDVAADLGIGVDIFSAATAEAQRALTPGCASGKENSAGLCYTPCPSGQTSDGAAMCYPNCPSGTKATPGFCNFPFGAVGGCPSGLSGLKPSCINAGSSRGAGTIPNVLGPPVKVRPLPGSQMATAQIAEAEAFYAQSVADSAAAKRKGTLAITGHSLGGFLAQVIGSRHAVTTTTFNAPGAAGTTTANAGKVRNLVRKSDVAGALGAHVGAVIKYRGVPLALPADPVLQNHSVSLFRTDLQAGMKPLP